jgi:hypothetical protein
LPQSTIEKLHYGHEMSAEETEQVNQAPRAAARLLGDIPRLEKVRAILGGSSEERRASADDVVRQGAQMLRIASDYDTLEAKGLRHWTIIEMMRDRIGRYDKALLDTFAAMLGNSPTTRSIRELPLSSVKAGMTLFEDVYLKNGTLLAARGYVVTDRFVERSRYWKTGTVREPVRVVG